MCLFSSSLLANDYDYRYQKSFRVQALSIEDGLSQSVVNDIIQDFEGYIWVATEDGLNRFDGYEFKIFEHKHNDLNSLHENLVYSLFEEPGKGLWIGTQKGLSFFNSSTEKFTSYFNQNNPILSAVANLNKINDDLFVGSDNGLYILNSNSNISIYQSPQGEVIEDEITSLEQSDNYLWVATEKCIYSIEHTTRDLTNYCQLAVNELLKSRTIKVVKFNDSKLWIATNNGLIYFDIKTENIRIFLHDDNNENSLAANWVQDLVFDNLGNLWIGSINGLDQYSLSEDNFKHFQRLPYDDEGLSSNDIMTVFIDATGLIWLGTYTGGLNILNPFQSGFQHILTKSDLIDFTSINTIHGITKDHDENLWLANFGGGLIRLNLMTGEISQPFNEELLIANQDNNYVYSLLYDSNNRLWVGATNELVIIDLTQQKLLAVDFVSHGKKIQLKDHIFQIYEDHNGTIWIATKNGYYKVKNIQSNNPQAKSNELTVELIEKHFELPLSYLERSNQVSILLETRDGNFWVGGQSGLAMHSKLKDRWFHFTYDINNPQSISNDDIQALYEDSGGVLWVGTANGLNKVKRNSDDDVFFERITKADGLPNNTIYGILEDNQNQLWLSTNLGLVQYSQDSNSIQSFQKIAGLSSNEFNKNAFFASSNGTLYFGSINGITVIDNKIMEPLGHKSNLKLTEVKIGQKNIDVVELNRSDLPLIEVPKNETVISISVADIYFRKLGIQTYRYRLLGLNDEWIELDKNRRFILAGLSEGEYSIEIQSKISGDDWAFKSLLIKLSVSEIFWKSKQFFYLGILIVSALLFGSIYSMRQFYLARLNKMKNRLKVETIRLNTEKDKNAELSFELDNKVTNLDKSKKDLGALNKVLESYQFRESSSGFFRFNSLIRVFAEYFSDTESSLAFNFVMVWQISNQNKIEQQYNKVFASELRSFMAAELKNTAPANCLLCFLNDDSFVVYGNSLDYKNLTNELFALRNKIENSYIEIGNNISVKTKITLSYFEINSQTINDTNLLLKLSECLINLHQKNNYADVSQIMRIDFNEKLKNYKNIDLDSEDLLLTKKVNLNFLL